MNFTRLFRRTFLLITLFVSAIAWAGDITWIDVRTPEEFSQKHVPDALNIPYDQIGAEISALGLAKDQEIYLYCGSGRRAGLAKETLESLGYTHVSNAGGLDAALSQAEKIQQE